MMRPRTLVRWYPEEWRARYGDEFAELLASDLAERPRSFVRDLDVARGALLAHLAALGLCGMPIQPLDQPRRRLATLSCALAVFLTFAASICSHLDIAWRSARPATPATHIAVAVMTVALIVTGLAAVAGAVPVGSTAIRAAFRPRGRALRRPLLVSFAGLAVLVAGALAFHNGWRAAGAAPSSLQSSGPGGPAAWLWIGGLAVSSYWAHPAVLARLPAGELAWMVLSPIAILCAAAGAAKTIRRLELSARLAHFVHRAARVAVAGVGVCLAATLAWLVDGGTGPNRLFQAGTVDRVGLAVMLASLVVALPCLPRPAVPRAA